MILRQQLYSYDESGNLLGTIEMTPPTPTRLQWEFSNALLKTIDEAYKDALIVVNVNIIYLYIS